MSFGKVEDCIFITANYHGEGSGLHSTKISNIYFSNISCIEATKTGIVIEGYPNEKIAQIELNNITIHSTPNGMTVTNTEKVAINEVIIGEKAITPTSVK